MTLAAALAACVRTSEPTGFVFEYGISLHGCGADCTTPGQAGVDTVQRGDTVWMRHDVRLLYTVTTIKTAMLRPACGQNAIVRSTTAAVDTVPLPTCPDSLESVPFELGDTLVRFNSWIVDSALAPGFYEITGRVLVQPRIEPQFVIVVE